MEEKGVEVQLLEKQIFAQFCSQLRKDVQTAGLDADILLEGEITPQNVRSKVQGAVHALSKGSGDGLRRLLYRVDIGEKQLNQFHTRHRNISFEEVVAELILRRILQKVIIRKKFSDE